MRVTVLGKSPSWADVDGACSGYLVQEGETSLLVDCGNGVFSKLRRFCDYVDIDAVVISHMHADHSLDLVPYSYALTYAPRQQPVPVPPWPGTDYPARPGLHIPEGGTEQLKILASLYGNDQLITNAFAPREYDPTDSLQIGLLNVRFHPVPHFVPTCAIEVSSAVTGGRFTYGADHSPDADYEGFAENTDLMMLESTLPRPEREGPRGHMTPSEAGAHAVKMNAGRLVLTHISDELDQTWAKAEAARVFAGPVEVAAEGAVYEL